MLTFNKDDIKNYLTYTLEFIQNPVERIKSIPDFPIPLLIISQVMLGTLVGIITGLLQLGKKSFWLVFLKNLIGAPFVLFLVTCFFYYFYKLSYQNKLSFQKIMGLLVFSSLPFLVFRMGVIYFSILHLIGLGFSTMLFFVGLVENFNLSRESTKKILTTIFIIYSISWSLALTFEVPSTYQDYPKDLDSIEKNLKN